VTVVNGYTGNSQRRLDAMANGLRLVGERRVNFGRLITHRFGLDDVDTAFGLFDERPAGFLKAVITPNLATSPEGPH